MAKSKSNKMQLFSFCTIVLAALGLILYMVLDAIKDGPTGAQVVFGVKSINAGSLGSMGFKFSFLLFLGLIFAVAGIVITILPLIGVKAKLFPVVAMACFIVAAIFAFLSVNCCVTYISSVLGGSTKMGLENGKLGIGAILAGIFYICSACTSALPAVLKK